MIVHWLKHLDWEWKEGDSPNLVHQWVKQLNEEENIDVLVFGAPLSRSSISVSGASQFPEQFRRMWPKFAPYNIDEGIDLTTLTVRDAGDVSMHVTDIVLSHERIEQATKYLINRFPLAITTLIGGDHSVTACAVKGVKKAFPNETIGILQLDTHLDVRNPHDLGPANGTPIRQLIDGGIVKGTNVINIGLHGYFNQIELVEYAKKHQIHLIPLKKAREEGVVNTVKTSLEQLKQQVDRIYVTIDFDVLDMCEAPGVPASTPGGMKTTELFASLIEIGKEEKVRHIDFVCLDPTKDHSSGVTVKIGVYAWMEFLTGVAMRKL